jgi:hypothetical protein
MKLPIKIKHDPMNGQPPAYFENLQLWWTIADRVFKFVGWCLVTSLIGSAWIRSRSTVLALVVAALIFILGMICLKIFVVKFQILIRDRPLSAYVGEVFSVIVGLLMTLSVLAGGLYASYAAVSALLSVQTIRQ